MTHNPNLADLMQRMADLTDPFWGTFADRDVPGKFEPSVFARHPVDDQLFYDVGNNAVSASVSPRGAIRRAQIFAGICDARVARLPGVWHGYEFIDFCHDTALAIESGERSWRLDQAGLNQETSFVLGAWPLTEAYLGALRVRQVVMAPLHGGQRLRALLVLLQLDTAAGQPVTGVLRLPPARQGEAFPVSRKPVGSGQILPGWRQVASEGDEKRAGYAAFTLLDGLEAQREGDALAFSVEPGAPTVIPVLLVMGATHEEFQRNRQAWGAIDSAQLASQTLDWFAARLGAFQVAGAPTPLASAFRRAIYAQLITPFVDENGAPAGSSWGSCASEFDSNLIWMMDTFYNYISAGMFDPQQYLDGARFFLLRSVPSQAAVDHWIEHGVIPEERERPHSLGNLVAPIVLAGAFYDATGDGAALRALAETDAQGERASLEARIVELLGLLLASRAPGSPHLFESQWLSDGPTRGKYHTGSNMLAWYAFRSAARLMGEVFGDEGRAAEYTAFADQMHDDIYTHCTAQHHGERMFNEGLQDILIHDGEESGSTVAPTLGFCPADDPALLHYKQFAATTENPKWSAERQGIIWENSGWITTPGFMSELAGAADEEQLAALLDKQCTLVDVDGGWWWWPLHVEQDEASRGPTGRCGWGTGVFLLHFVHTILGVNWDAPTQALTIKPFVPWTAFSFQGLRVGALQLDLAYRASKADVTVEVTHNQPQLQSLRLVLRVPEAMRDCRLIGASADCALAEGTPYFGKPTWEVAFGPGAGQKVSVTLGCR